MAEAQPLEESPRIVGAHNRHLLPISLKQLLKADCLPIPAVKQVPSQGERKSTSKIKSKAIRPLRYLPILLIAAAVAESVHAPFIGHSKASTAKVEPGKPAADAFLQLPATTVRPSAEHGFSGVTVPNGSVNKGR